MKSLLAVKPTFADKFGIHSSPAGCTSPRSAEDDLQWLDGRSGRVGRPFNRPPRDPCLPLYGLRHRKLRNFRAFCDPAWLCHLCHLPAKDKAMSNICFISFSPKICELGSWRRFLKVYFATIPQISLEIFHVKKIFKSVFGKEDDDLSLLIS